MSQSARLKKANVQEIGARLGTLSKANRETVEVSVDFTKSLLKQLMIMYYHVFLHSTTHSPINTCSIFCKLTLIILLS